LHPGYFLPTVAGGLVASTAATEVGQRRLGEVMFGLGMICWLILGSMIMARLFFRPPLPTPLQPTLAIEVAPAAVASLAWLARTEGRFDTVAAALAGYGLLMVVAQVRLLPGFVHLRFMPSVWSFTFSWAAVVNAALRWNEHGRPAGHLAYTYVLLTAISLLIGGIAVRTLMALARGQLLPVPQAGAGSSKPGRAGRERRLPRGVDRQHATNAASAASAARRDFHTSQPVTEE
jgi:tellurite resistance protein